jgi:hypothetical protein
MPYVKIVDRRGNVDKYAEEQGCVEPMDRDWYDYVGEERGYRQCFEFTSWMTNHALSKYRHIQHLLLDGECEKGTECLCVRYPRYNMNDQVVVVKHKVGECSMCHYKVGEVLYHD